MIRPIRTIRTIVVDDEPPARKRLLQLLELEADVEVIGEARSAREAIPMINRAAPHLLFLDVQMHRTDGFSVLAALEPVPPAVVFVTAHHEHAVRAFEVDAVDYLVKPLSRERMAAALQRVRKELDDDDQTVLQRIDALARLVQGDQDDLRRIAVRVGNRIRLIETDTIDMITAAGNYLHLHVGSGRHLLRDALQNLEQRLDPARFVRVNRSAIVNLERVRELVSHAHGDYLLRMHDGQEVLLSRKFRDRFRGLFGPEF